MRITCSCGAEHSSGDGPYEALMFHQTSQFFLNAHAPCRAAYVKNELLDHPRERGEGPAGASEKDDEQRDDERP